MGLSGDKCKISAYLDGDLKQSASRLAKGRGMSLSTLVAFLLSAEVRGARKSGELSDK